MSSNLKGDARWVELAKNAFHTSDTYFDANFRRQLERNVSAFHSRHPAGSKYNSAAFKFRSKIYRPKTRTVIRQHEAATALAYFSTADVVTMRPQNENSLVQHIGAKILTALMRYRLENSVDWFVTLIGAVQDCHTYGACCSMQHWEYKEKTHKEPALSPTGEPLYDEFGEPAMMESVEVLKDKPSIRLVPLENIRIDPASDWNDPIGTSPYIIELVPMYIKDALARMSDEGEDRGERKWIKKTETELRGARDHTWDSIRQKREYERTDSKDAETHEDEFDVIWVHRNIIQSDGVDYYYYTLGEAELLSKPVPLKEVFAQGRPYVMGMVNLETHKIYPAGTTELSEGLQGATNEIANQRIDNVKLALNRRYFARRTAGIDYRSLTRNVPGSVTLMNDPAQDVKVEAPPDVTSSSYAEQDRLNLDFDDLVGSFSAGTMQANRALNETKGGMDLISDGASVMSEYQMRLFNETWVVKVLNQMAIMEQEYETDETIMQLAGETSGMVEKYKLQSVSPAMFTGKMMAKADVGFGTTSPEKRIQKLSVAVGTVTEFLPHLQQGLDEEMIISEVFGAVGYKDGKRFFKHLNGSGEEDPQVQQLKQQLQQLQQQLNSDQMEWQAKASIEQIKQQGAGQREMIKGQTAKEVAGVKSQTNINLQHMKNAIAMIAKRLESEVNEMDRQRLQMEMYALMHQSKVQEIKMAQEERNTMAEVLQNDQYAYLPGREDIYKQ